MSLQNSKNRSYNITILLISAFLAGLTSLNYELLWIRELKLITGSTQASISSILSIYFLGIAFGNYLISKKIEKIKNPLFYYIVAEVIIAGWALLFYTIFTFTDTIYKYSYPWITPHPTLSLGLRISIIILLIFIPSTCMGLTIPLLTQHCAARLKSSFKASAWLYGTNTLGAVTGTFATGFYLVEQFGISGTLKITMIINILTFIIVTPFLKIDNTNIENSVQIQTINSSKIFSHKEFTLLLCFGIMGFIHIAFEVLWNRFYSLIYHNDIYIFSTLLIIFLLGSSLGTLIANPLIKYIKRPVYTIGFLLLLSAYYTIMTLYSIPILVPNLLKLFNPSFLSLILNYFISVIMGTFFQAFCMGVSFTLIIKALSKSYREAGVIVGKALASNTMGGVIGSIVAGFILLDILGLQDGIFLILFLMIGLGFYLSFSSASGENRLLIPLYIFTTPLIILLLFISPDIPKSLIKLHLTSKMRIMETKPSVHGTVTVTEDYNGERRIWINNSWIARESEHLQFGYVPWILHTGPVNSALGICFGTGRSFGGLLLAGVPKMDLVEINPAVIELAGRWFARSNNNILKSQKANIIIDDGRNFVRYSNQKYDLITMEPLQMFQKNVVYFYTENFYREATLRLNKGGVISQWLPLYIPNSFEFKSMIKTFVTVFPNSYLWGKGGNSILLGYNTPLNQMHFDLEEIYKRMTLPNIKKDLEQEELNSKYDILSFMLLDGKGLAELSKDGKIYTDDHPELEFSSPRVRGSVRENIKLIKSYLPPINKIFDLPNKKIIKKIDKLRKKELNSL